MIACSLTTIYCYNFTKKQSNNKMKKQPQTLHVVSLGCSKNQVDTEVMLSRLGGYEMSDDPSSADLIIVNTCGFIDAAKQESINTIMRLHDERKESSTLVMAGCLSERYKEELQKELPEVDLFTGVGDYARIDELVCTKQSSFSPEVFLQTTQERRIVNSAYHAYVKLAEGCNQSCSFCAIPSFKGVLQSRDVDQVADEAVKLSKQGFYDLSFISQDSSSYLRDKGVSDGLVRLINSLDAAEGDFYARILYLYPSTTDERLIDAIAKSKRVLPYFDMPIQHIHDAMLKRMKRGSGEKRIRELLALMRAVPNSFVRTTVIVGHPGESDEEFATLLQFLTEFDFDAVSVFAYSDEEGTAAFDMDNKIEKKTVTKRLKEVQKLLEKQSAQRAKRAVGSKLQVSIEGESDEHEFLTAAKARIWAPDIDGQLLINESEVENLRVGVRYTATVTQAAKDTLIATITAEC